MNAVDRYVLVRAASLYVALMATGVIWFWRRPGKANVTGAILAWLWNVPAILIVNVLAMRAGWWAYDARGGLLFGVPVDLWLSWSWLWGAVPALAFPSAPMVWMTIGALAIDLALMPGGTPVIQLGPSWILGDIVALAVAFVPSQYLARWTVRDTHLVGRAVLQMFVFTGLMLIVLPAIVLESTGGVRSHPLAWSGWAKSLAMQLLAVPVIVGVSAVQEFVTRGGGTPVPFDPPKRLVTSGIYAYIRNPMQLSAVVLLTLVGAFIDNWWLAAAGVVAHLYSIGLAGWDEDADLASRFGIRWNGYRRSVRAWIPRWYPWHDPGLAPARLFVAEECGMCRDVARWFEARHARQLNVIPAETHPSGSLTRVTYETGDGSRPASGIEAIARALEHIHLGWAMLGCLLRIPGILAATQLLADASGAGPRRVVSRPLQARSGERTI